METLNYTGGKSRSRRYLHTIPLELQVDTMAKRIAILEMELQTAKRTKEEYRANLQDLSEEHERLRADYQEAEEARTLMAHALYCQEQDRHARLAALENEFTSLLAKSEEERQQLSQKAEAEQRELLEQLESKEERLRLCRLELIDLQHLDRDRMIMRQQLNQLKTAVLEVTGEHEKVIRRLESKFIKESRRLHDTNEAKFEELAREAHSKAICNLSRKTVQVFQDNVELMTSVRSLMDDHAKIKEQARALHSELLQQKQLREAREVALQDAFRRIEAYTKVVHQLGETNREIEEKCAQEARRQADEYLQLQKNSKEREAVDRAELRRLSGLLKSSERQLELAKRRSRAALAQRGDIERFLGSALQHVQNQLAKRASLRPGRLSVKDIIDREDCQEGKDLLEKMMRDGPESRVDWDELSWHQKERVLRYLFMQINYSRRVAQRQYTDTFGVTDDRS